MSEDPNNAWNNKTGSFIKRPGKGWLHPDEKLEREEVVYHIKVSLSLSLDKVVYFCFF